MQKTRHSVTYPRDSRLQDGWLREAYGRTAPEERGEKDKRIYIIGREEGGGEKEEKGEEDEGNKRKNTFLSSNILYFNKRRLKNQ